MHVFTRIMNGRDVELGGLTIKGQRYGQ
jgi:hypothetical protein